MVLPHTNPKEPIMFSTLRNHLATVLAAVMTASLFLAAAAGPSVSVVA